MSASLPYETSRLIYPTPGGGVGDASIGGNLTIGGNLIVPTVISADGSGGMRATGALNALSNLAGTTGANPVLTYGSAANVLLWWGYGGITANSTWIFAGRIAGVAGYAAVGGFGFLPLLNSTGVSPVTLGTASTTVLQNAGFGVTTHIIICVGVQNNTASAVTLTSLTVAYGSITVTLASSLSIPAKSAQSFFAVVVAAGVVTVTGSAGTASALAVSADYLGATF